jgi:hypothetical protein
MHGKSCVVAVRQSSSRVSAELATLVSPGRIGGISCDERNAFPNPHRRRTEHHLHAHCSTSIC